MAKLVHIASSPRDSGLIKNSCLVERLHHPALRAPLLEEEGILMVCGSHLTGHSRIITLPHLRIAGGITAAHTPAPYPQKPLHQTHPEPAVRGA